MPDTFGLPRIYIKRMQERGYEPELDTPLSVSTWQYLFKILIFIQITNQYN